MSFRKLSIPRILALSLPYAWISVFNAVLDNGLPVILTAPAEDGGLALSFVLKGVVMALDNILGLFLLPLFGVISDRSRSRFGKRTLFIVTGGILAALLWAGAGIALGLRQNWPFLILLSGALAGIALSRPAGLAVLPDFTPLPQRRTANAVTQMVSIFCTVAGILLISALTPLGYEKVFYAVSALMGICIAVFLLTVKERKWTVEKGEEKEKADVIESGAKRGRIFLLVGLFFFYVSYNGLVSSLSNYAIDVLGLSKQQFVLPQGLTLLAAVVFAVPAARLAKRFKRKTLLLAGIGVMMAAFTAAGLQPSLNAVMLFCFFFTGAGFSVMLINLYPFLLELSDSKKVGASTGIFNTVMTVAMVLTPIVSGALIDYAGWGLKILFPYCIGALALSFVAILLIFEPKRVRLGNSAKRRFIAR